MENHKKLKGSTRVLLVLCGAMLLYSIFVPLWRIELDAPQYPEGLELLIYPNTLGGNVNIINGLNHYIGMREIHEQDFTEFRVLPYIIGAFAAACVLVALLGRKKLLYVLLGSFVAFGIVAMIDFYKWEYEYGHDLSPHAAIIVPGQAYQPPLIGFKQLLNFGAYSVPATGGWLFVLSGVLMVIGVMTEKNLWSRLGRHKTRAASAAVVAVLLSSCGPQGPEQVKVNKDNCDNCKMTISDPRFAAELITKKGRLYKFDDLICLRAWVDEHNDPNTRAYVANFNKPDEYLELENALYVNSSAVNSPMGGNTAAFSTKAEATMYSLKVKGNVTDWEGVPQ